MMTSIPRLLLLAITLPLSPCLQAGELGRLFYTPQQRQHLEYDSARHHSARSGTSSHRSLVVDGVVQKQGGNRTIWINGQAQEIGRGNDKTPASVPVTVPGRSQPVQMKVGQSLTLDASGPLSK